MSNSTTINNLSFVLKNTNFEKQTIIYCRSSSKIQNQFNHSSLETQLYYCNEYSKTNNLNVKSNINEVCSATKINKQKKLLEIVNTCNNIHLVVYDATRFSRNILEGIKLLIECKNKNIIIHNVKDNYSTQNYQGYLNFIEGIKNGEIESKLISERVKHAIQLKKLKGNKIGIPSFGLMRQQINGLNKFVPNQNEMLIKDLANKLYFGCSMDEINKIMIKMNRVKITKIFTEPCTKIEYGNCSYSMIAEFFNNNNIKNRNDREWNANSISNIINKRINDNEDTNLTSNKKMKTEEFL
jgi:DNA invertase Pin-like site-specific DNA recombinase